MAGDKVALNLVAATASWSLILLLTLLPVINLLWPTLLLAALWLSIPRLKLLLILPLKLLVPSLDRLLDVIGGQLLSAAPFRNFFAGWQDLPVVPLFRFNSTLVAGSLALLPVVIILAYLLVCYPPWPPLAVKLFSRYPFYRRCCRRLTFCRLPRLLKEPLREKKFAQLSRRLDAPERQEFTDFFSAERCGFRRLNRVKFLNNNKVFFRLYRAARPPRWPHLTILFILLSGLLIGGKGLLLDYFAEKFLGELNRAQVDVDGLQAAFSATAIRLSWDAVAFTNPATPTENRLELAGPGELVLVLADLLKGRFYFDSIRITVKEFGTLRRFPGWVATDYQRAASLKNDLMADFIKLLPNIEPANIIDHQQLTAGAAAIIVDLQQYYQQRFTSWDSLIAEEKSNITSFRDRVEEVFQRKVDWENLPALRLLQQDLQNLLLEGRNFVSQADEDLATLLADVNELQQSWQLVAVRLSQDLDTFTPELANFVTLANLEQPVGQLLSNYAATFQASYPVLAIIKQRLFTIPAEVSFSTPEQRLRPRQRFVTFLQNYQPAVYIRDLFFTTVSAAQGDGSTAAANDHFYLRLNDFGDYPAMLDQPIIAVLTAGDEDHNYRANVVVDAAAKQLRLELQLFNLPLSYAVDTANSPPAVGGFSYHGASDHLIKVTLRPEQLDFNGKSFFYDGAIDNADSYTGRLLQGIFQNKLVEIELQLHSTFAGIDSLSLTGNFDQLANAALVNRDGALQNDLKQRIGELASLELENLWQQELVAALSEKFTNLLRVFGDERDILLRVLNDINEKYLHIKSNINSEPPVS